MSSPAEAASSAATPKAAWIELFRDGRAVFTVLLNLGITMHALDIFIMTTIMPSVVADIGGLAYYTWTSMLYMVGSIVGAASAHWVRARIGRRRAYMWSGFGLLIGTVGCAIPPDMATLLAARVAKGLAGGLIIAQSMALVSDLYEPRIRTRILALITGTWSVASLLGPALGGIFAEIGWWRGAFWATVPFVLAFAWMAGRTLPETAASAPGRRLPWRRLGLLALGVIAVGVTGHLHNLPLTILLIAVSATLVWLTFRIDAVSDHRLFPTQAMSAFSPVGLAYWVYFMISVTHTGLLIFAPLFLQVLLQLSPLWVGYLSLVFSIGWTIGSVAVAGWHGPWERVATVGGMVLTAVTVAGFAASVLHGSLPIISIVITIAGLGIGMSNVHMTAFGMLAARKGEESVTASAMQTVRSLGVAFGAAAAGLIANAAGLDRGMEAETVRAVALWVLGLVAVVPALAAIAAFRAHRLAVPAAPHGP